MGSSSKQTVGYFYYKSLQGVLCHSPIDAITQIECDDRRISNKQISGSGIYKIEANDVFGGTDREGGISGDVEFMFGEENQQPSQFMSDILGNYVPANRGVVSVVFQDLYMGLNPYMRSFKYMVRRVTTGWYDEKSEIGSFYEFYEEDDDRYSEDMSIQIKRDTTYANTTYLDWTDVYSYNGEYYSPDSRRANGFIVVGYINDSDYEPIIVTTTYDIPKVGIVVKIDYLLDDINCGDFRYTVLGVLAKDIEFNGRDENGFLKISVYYAIPEKEFEEDSDYERVGITATARDPLDNSGGTKKFGARIYSTFEVCWNMLNYWSYGDDTDLNPAHIVRDCLINKKWGLGIPEELIDDVAFKKCADQLFFERMGMSIVWSNTSTIFEFMQLVCDHVQAVMPHQDINTGLWTWALLRDDYEVTSLIHLDESNIIKCKEYKRKTLADMVNVVTVSYTDRSQGKTSSVTVDNPARVAQQGKIIEHKVEYEGFTNSELASRVALRDLKTLSKELSSVTIQAQSVAKSLKVGSCFTWSWDDYGISRAVMRVTKIKRGGMLTSHYIIEAIEDSFSTPMESVIPYVKPTQDNFELAKPARSIAFEAPYYELVQTVGQTQIDNELEQNNDSGFIIVGATTDQNAINAKLMTSSGADFEDVGVVDFTFTARLISTLDRMQDEFVVSAINQEISENTYFKLNSELMAFVSYERSTSTIKVKRGVLDTIPVYHNANSELWFIDEDRGYDETQYFEGQIIAAKVLPNTGTSVLAIENAPTNSVLIESRAFRPYPPANVKINGEYYPTEFTNSIVLTWVDRNRISETGSNFVGYYESGLVVEDGVEYIAELRDEDNQLVDYQEVGSLNTATLDASSLSTNVCKIIVYSKRDGYESYQKFEHIMINPNYISTPYNLTAEYTQ